MNIGIPSAMITSTLVNLSITLKRRTSMRGTFKTSVHVHARFPPIRYSFGNTDIYACELQYYPRKTYIRAGDL